MSEPRLPWPIQCKPLPDESLESWTVRQAGELGITLGEFRRVFLGAKASIHYDLVDESPKALVDYVSWLGLEAVSNMTLMPFRENLKESWDFWVTSRLGYRWICPSCFARGKYLRRDWRFDIPVCFEHGTFLERRCPRCRAPFNFIRTNQILNLGACPNCGQTLHGAPTRHVGHNSAGFRAAEEVMRLVHDRSAESPVDWLRTRAEFFAVMTFVMRFLLVLNGKGGGIHGRAIARNGQLWMSTLGQAWITVQSRDTIGALARDNQRMFNKYGGHPSTMAPRVLRRYRRNPSLQDRSSLWQAARAISGRDEVLSYAKLGKELGLAGRLVYNRASPKLKEYMREQRKYHFVKWKVALRELLTS